MHLQAHSSRTSVVIRFLFLLAAAVLPASATGVAQDNATVDSASSPCASFINSKFPEAVLSNGAVQAVVYLPDAQNGYYRASRFDWSGVVPCLTYKGHTYFGIWFDRYDPMIHDAIAGPVEEFRSSDGLSSIGYSEAEPGGLFIKPGVGVLRKVDNSPYRFAFTYEQVDRGKWTVHIKRDQVTFTQTLRSPIGISFVYEKTLKLAKNEPVLLVEHHLKNIGSKPIDSEVYNHDFYMIDKTPTGPGMVVHFPFAPQPKTSLGPRAKIDGHDLVYLQDLSSQGPGARQVSSYLIGFSDNPSDYDITVENKNTGVGVEQTADVPISQLNFWSISTTICPEAYVHLNVAPGQTTHWNIRYRFFAR
jgi:hypothetical protein